MPLHLNLNELQVAMTTSSVVCVCVVSELTVGGFLCRQVKTGGIEGRG